MKNTLLSIIIAWACTASYAQSWSTVGKGADSVLSLTVYNNQLIVGGYFKYAGGIPANYIASWNGTVWDTLGGGLAWPGFEPEPFTLQVYNNNLYVGGYFTFAGRKPSDHIAEWNGAAWDSTGIVQSTTSCMVACYTVYNGNLIAGGAFKNLGIQGANYIGSWNGTSWSAIGSATALNSQVQTVCVYNGNLIAGGFFDSAAGKPANYIAQWDGTSWSPLGKGLSGVPTCFTIYNGNLIACGSFDSAGGQSANSIAQWNGTSWSTLGTVGTEYGGWVNTMTNYNGKLVAAGFYFSIDGVTANSIAEWNGTSWSAMGSGIGGNLVNAVAAYNGELYAGGYFTTAGGIPDSGIAVWSEPLAVNELTQTHSLDVTIYPNPSNGVFNIQLSGNNDEKSVIVIYNMLGEKVYSQQWIMENEKVTVDLGNYPNGIYLYRVLNEIGTSVSDGKFIIQK